MPIVLVTSLTPVVAGSLTQLADELFTVAVIVAGDLNATISVEALAAAAAAAADERRRCDSYSPVDHVLMPLQKAARSPLLSLQLMSVIIYSRSLTTRSLCLCK